MSLVDTADNVLMIGAYGWAFSKPMRKLYYNLTITFTSVIVALVVGGVQALGLVARHTGWQTGFWGAINTLNDHFGAIGYLIIGLFVACWGGSVLVYRLKRYDVLESA